MRIPMYQGRRGLVLLGMLVVLTALFVAGCLGSRRLAPNRAALVIGSTPVDGASIFLNSVDTGAITPHDFTNLTPGAYSVKLVRMGFPDTQANVLVVEGKPDILTADLAEGNGRIRGYVTESRGGIGVAGAKVEAPHSYTLTDASGHYELYVPPGRYDVVATKPGRAVSVRQGIVVAQGTTAEANIIQREIFRSDELASPLRLEISGIRSGDEITQPVQVDVNVVGASHTTLLAVRIGHQHPLTVDHETIGSMLSFTIDPYRLGPGPTYIHVTAYDIEYNSVQSVIEFKVVKESHHVPGVAPPSPQLVAYTTSQSAGYFSAFASDPPVLPLNDSNPSSATRQPNHFVEITWNAITDASGYRIYRRIGEAGHYQAIADIVGGATSYLDADPELQPGPFIYYRMASFSASGDLSHMSEPVRVFLLEPFAIYLQSPSAGSIQRAGTVEFAWKRTHLPARPGYSYEYAYDLQIQKTTAQIPDYRRRFTGIEAAAVNGFKACTQYEWDLIAASVTVRISAEALAVSVSGSEMASGASLNGGYTFSTVCQ